MTSAARVDKSWKTQGLGKYELGAILGTLGHYGVSVDEPGFKSLAAKQYPLGIAQDWLQQWKGTGQFSAFPVAAAQELWKRLVPEKTPPSVLTDVVIELVEALTEMVKGSPEAKVGPAFKKLDELKPKLPREKDEVAPAFVDEAFAVLPRGFLEHFDALAEKLAAEGHVDDAESFALVEELLFPVRRQVATAMVKAAQGQKDEAQKMLEARADDAKLSEEARVLAVDGLLHIGANEAAQGRAERLLEAAEKSENHHLALALVDRLAELYKRNGNRQRLQELGERADRLVEAHNRAHPHHHH